MWRRAAPSWEHRGERGPCRARCPQPELPSARPGGSRTEGQWGAPSSISQSQHAGRVFDGLVVLRSVTDDSGVEWSGPSETIGTEPALPVPLVSFDLVIFDCDGVLVDSERLAVRTEARILRALGWPLSHEEIVVRFLGRSAAYMHAQIELHLGRSVDWDAEFETRYRDVFRRELVAVDGIIDTLDRIEAPVCVASSGTQEKIRSSLALTGLLDRFEGRIFSAQDVAHGKPAPDLFLSAAATLGAAPSKCAVVEDSVSGVQAGLSAGMTTFGFATELTRADRFPKETHVVFEEIRELPGLLAVHSPTTFDARDG